MRAFGPFGREQRVDFTEMGERSLFLIHGPTGSGKTTILDAICFALYGDSSGGDRKGRGMRSDHADPFLATEVIFDFSLRGRTYRVYRRPDQERPKKRGSGTTAVKADAAFRQLSPNDDPDDERPPDVTQWKRVTEHVEELLGFRSDQFRQVVVLPQGRFRRLLTADSRERQAIMEALFRTAFYSRIEDALKNAADALARRMKDLEAEQSFILKQSEADSREELREALEQTTERLKELGARKERLIAADKAAQDELAAARRTRERLEEQRKAREDLERLKALSPEFDTKRGLLARAVKAAALAPVKTALEERRKESMDADKRLAESRAEHKAAEEAIKAARERFERERDREPERDEARRERDRLEGLKDKVTDLDASRRTLAQALQSVKAAEKERHAAADAMERLNDELEAKGPERDQAKDEAAKVEYLQAKLAADEKSLEALNKLTKVRSKGAKLGKKCDVAAHRASDAEAALTQAQIELRGLEETWITGQAAFLAQALNKGDPCPVCGSLDHPAPARADRHIPDKEALEAKRAECEELRIGRDAAIEEKSRIEREVATLQASAKALEDQLGALSQKDPKKAESTVVETRKELEGAKQAQKWLGTIEKRIRDVREAMTKAREQLASADKRYDDAQGLLRAAQARVEEREAGVPEAERDPKALKNLIKRAGRRLEELEAAFESARSALSEAEQTSARLLSTVQSAETAALTAAETAKTRAEEFQAKLIEAGFPDEAAFEKARRSKAEIERLENEINEFSANLSAAGDRAARAEADAADLEEPDLESLEGIAQQRRAELNEALRQEGTVSAALKRLEGLAADFDTAAKKYDTLDREYRVMGRISSVANGKNDAGMTFQRFVLSVLLDDVLAAASERLRLMSGGRYLLRRVEERADKRSAGGLDLAVDDAYTGSPRPVATLSGGEGFLASLALALGLADVVQSYAGGISLETIFIDEGFGSLDPETLDLAYKTLADLQRHGRLVGIISHVPELRELIGTRLELTSGRTGSSARFALD